MAVPVQSRKGRTTLDVVDAEQADSTSTATDNEKEEKVQRLSVHQFRQFLLIFFVLSVAALFLGQAQRSKANLQDRSMVFVEPVEPAEPVPQAKEAGPSEAELEGRVQELDRQVRALKAQKGIIMETDPTALEATKKLQTATRELLVRRYGDKQLRVQMELTFPPTIPDYHEGEPSQFIVMELAPIDLIPCSVFNFLEIARTWKGGSFHRNAGHVLQANSKSDVTRPMPFQEYNDKYPHKKMTMGYAGRPSGPGFYVSIMDNSRNHGPGSQQHHNPYEADSLFGRVVVGMDDVVPRIHTIPQDGWLSKENQIPIVQMTILIQDGNTQEWVPHKV